MTRPTNTPLCEVCGDHKFHVDAGFGYCAACYWAEHDHGDPRNRPAWYPRG